MSNYDFFNTWGYSELNGNGGFIPMCKCGDVSKEEIVDVVNEVIDEKTTDLDIKEENDKLYVGGKEVMTDDYVKSGVYNADGTVTLQVGEDKTATIENLPQEMSEEDVKNILKL